MTQIPERVLSWLWSVLQPYSQPQVAYSDCVAALTEYTTLQPRTAVYTYENGSSALLLCLAGTLPVTFRGSLYKFPLEIWIPQEYGNRGVAIICYVKPGEGAKGRGGGEIVTRPGQHVGVDGRIYHPYLRDWGSRERSNIVTFLRIAQDIFAKEPPVITKPPDTTPPPRHPQSTQTPIPPPKQRPGSIQSAETSRSSGPPPLPAKPGQQQQEPPSRQYHQSHGSDGPPLPPLPPIQANGHAPMGPMGTYINQYQHTYTSSAAYQSNGNGHRHSATHNVPPPLQYLPSGANHQQHQPNGERSPVSPLSPQNRAELSGSGYRDPPAVPISPNGPSVRQTIPPANGHAHTLQAYQQPPQAHQQSPHYDYQQQSHAHAHAHQIHQQYPQNPSASLRQPSSLARTQQPPKQVARPPVDLLTDPFDISLPASSAAIGPPPPIPPNPEREHLLSMLSTSLVSQINAKLQQNASALAPLRAQNAALHDAHARLNAELLQLRSLDSVLSTNETILHRSLRDCDAVIQTSKSTPAPNIDEVLVAPTIAAQQLWNLCAEDAAIKEALWCLQRAVGAGRVSGPEFVRLTRGLARESFLKMALSRKIAKGLGLDLGYGKEAFSAI